MAELRCSGDFSKEDSPFSAYILKWINSVLAYQRRAPKESGENIMLNRIHHSKRVYLIGFLLIVGLSGVVWGVTGFSTGIIQQAGTKSADLEALPHAISQADARLEALKHLPSESTITNKDVVLADLDSDGQQEIVIFYTVRNGNDYQANILALKQTGTDYVQLWEDIYTGSVGFADPSGVYDLNKSGKPQIVAYRKIGASCPGVLDIYQYAGGSIEKISSWADTCQSDLEIKDLNGDGVLEILFRRLKYGVNRDIYSWNGTQYAQSNSQFAQHYETELEKLLQSVYSGDPLPASARVVWCEQAVRIYILQKRHSEAKQLCDSVLQILDDPNLTTPNSVLKGDESPELRNRLLTSLEVEKARGKATIYRLLGDTYKAAGDLEQAKKLYKAAQKLEAEAEEKESVLLR